VLRVQEIDVFYRNIQALRQVSLFVEEKEMVIVLGANGAGKSTLLKTISGLCPLGSGHMEFQGRQLDGTDPSSIVKFGICHCPEGRKVFPKMTVLKNLMLGAYVREGRREIARDLERCFELFPILNQRKEQLAGSLSGGEQQMLAIARSLMGRPSLLMMDEPSMGLAPIIVSKVAEYIKKINEQGVTILLVEQNAKTALSIGNRGYVMERGQITMSGSCAELIVRKEVVEAYLGGTE